VVFSGAAYTVGLLSRAWWMLGRYEGWPGGPRAASGRSERVALVDGEAMYDWAMIDMMVVIVLALVVGRLGVVWFR